MANLYQIKQEIEAFEYEVDEETGELTNALVWDELCMAYEEKVENIACYIKNLASDVLAFKTEEEALAKRRKSAERTIEYLKNLLADNMDGEKFSTAKCAITLRKTVKVEISDIEQIPAELIRTRTTVEADKTAIKAAIKAGKEISGCKLVESISTQVK